MTEIQTLCRQELPEAALIFDAPMSRYTTFRVGGPAEVLFMPRSAAELVAALRLARAHDIPVTVIGNGSNLVVRDRGINGLVIRLSEAFSEITVEGGTLTAQAGALLSKLSAKALDAGLTGLEFASGIPGSVGGGCAMNAGAYGGQLSDVLVSARVLDVCTLEIRDYSIYELDMGYRSTRVLTSGDIVLTAAFRLHTGDKTEIRAKMDGLNARRREKQPLTFPSAGSTFKRPEGYFAGALIEQAGLKGLTIGGAQVSEKHAGFIINTGSATAADILELIAEVQARVQAASGVTLEPEVRILG